MDNTLSSMLSALNTYHQRNQIDQDSLLAGNIKVYSANNANANTALTSAISALTSAYPNANQYDVLSLVVIPADASSITAVITIRLNQ